MKKTTARIKGAEREHILSVLADPTLTGRQQAKILKVAHTTITDWRQREWHEIWPRLTGNEEWLARYMNNPTAPIWIKDKEQRVLRLQAAADVAAMHILRPITDEDGEFVGAELNPAAHRAYLDAIHKAAEQLGELPTRQTINVGAEPAPVNITIHGPGVPELGPVDNPVDNSVIEVSPDPKEQR